MSEENEIVAAARDAKTAAKRTDKPDNWPLAVGVGLGIGSAALAAALLYSRRSKKDDE